MNKAFFLDRDGTLNVDFNFVHTPERWAWCSNALKALEWIQRQGFKIIVVTNQSGIARGRYSAQAVEKLHRWVDDQLEEQGLSVDAWYYAAHHPEYDPAEQYPPGDRKPGTGMFEKAAREHRIDFRRSYMAGDKITDLQPAVELGMHPLFIRSRHAPHQDSAWLDRHNIDRYDTLWQGIQSLRKA